MITDDCSRRNFLKRFALLSAGTLVLTTPVLACYGPGPGSSLEYPLVSGMYFLDAQGRTTLLYDNQNVPVSTKFSIEFTDDMDTSAPTTVNLNDPSNAPVAVTKVWDTVRILTLTPDQSLALNSSYTLNLTNAQDSRGYHVTITDSASAVFKTVIA